jgi:hypothetical protein
MFASLIYFLYSAFWPRLTDLDPSLLWPHFNLGG